MNALRDAPVGGNGGAPAPVLDLETKAEERPHDHHDELRLWLRMLACTNLIEGAVRRRLRAEFAVTLPRFDLMAQLDKARDGMALGEVSRRLMVSNGNVTAVVDRLVEEGLVGRRAAPNDRRVQIVSLTDAGRSAFRAMARRHEDWIASLFAGLEPAEVETLTTLLGRLKRSVREGDVSDEAPATSAPAHGRPSPANGAGSGARGPA